MAEFVLDASVAVSWCFPGDPAENTPYSRHILGLPAAHDAVVPEIWAFEVANSIFVSFSKRKRITEPQIQEYLQRLRALPIRVEPREVWSNVGLESQSRRWNLTPYDAAYLDLAKRLALPLATVDDDLKRAARAEGIEVLSQ
jgi:predicted nucleic acid-binding protein